MITVHFYERMVDTGHFTRKNDCFLRLSSSSIAIYGGFLLSSILGENITLDYAKLETREIIKVD